MVENIPTLKLIIIVEWGVKGIRSEEKYANFHEFKIAQFMGNYANLKHEKFTDKFCSTIVWEIYENMQI